jgi:hypothetical protein
MLWVSYGKMTQEGIKGMVANPSNRAEPVGKLMEALGGQADKLPHVAERGY